MLFSSGVCDPCTRRGMGLTSGCHLCACCRGRVAMCLASVAPQSVIDWRSPCRELRKPVWPLKKRGFSRLLASDCTISDQNSQVLLFSGWSELLGRFGGRSDSAARRAPGATPAAIKNECADYTGIRGAGTKAPCLARKAEPEEPSRNTPPMSGGVVDRLITGTATPDRWSS